MARWRLQMHTSLVFMLQRMNMRKARTRKPFEVLSHTKAAARPVIASQHTLLSRSRCSLDAAACTHGNTVNRRLHQQDTLCYA
jgi:hypothetical protein